MRTTGGAVTDKLSGWSFYSTLGDNEAGAIGSGLSDSNTIVCSMGTSGTVVRRTDPLLPLLNDKVLQFENHDWRLLLSMLPDCGSWWQRFTGEHGGGREDREIDALAFAVNDHVILRDSRDCQLSEFTSAPLDVKAASVQIALVGGMMEQFRAVLSAVNDPGHDIMCVVWTGGLSRSPLIRKTLLARLREDHDITEVFVSALTGPAAQQAAARGALINALVGAEVFEDFRSAVEVFCPLVQLK